MDVIPNRIPIYLFILLHPLVGKSISLPKYGGVVIELEVHMKKIGDEIYNIVIDAVGAGETLKSIERTIDITPEQIHKILKAASTPEKVVDAANKNLMLNFGSIMRRLITESNGGNVQAIRILFDYIKTLFKKV